uniref:Centromere protein Cenp-F N-terminal domain-containing protein n=1 Tax=Hippocampus comes TaxID=109280 RepID=A0A3Q2Z8D9_HIPCM
MSWAEEDWTAGLSGRVLQKVKELQTHHERLSRENKQKQLQLDNIHVSHDKQTVKVQAAGVECSPSNLSSNCQSVVRGLPIVVHERITKLNTKNLQHLKHEV